MSLPQYHNSCLHQTASGKNTACLEAVHTADAEVKLEEK